MRFIGYLPIILLLITAGCASVATSVTALDFPYDFQLNSVGTSMLPTITPGDVLQIRRVPYDSLMTGMIIAYVNAWNLDTRATEKLTTHRLQRMSGHGWVAVGDNNTTRDLELVTKTNYVGVVIRINDSQQHYT